MDLEKLKRSLLGRTPGLMDATGQYSVLVPLVEREGGLSLLYEVRAGSLRRQPGEVCFPGGRLEVAESPEECALRETWEELGIPVQESVRTGGSTNGAPIHLSNQGVPVIVIGIPVRYIHTHYGIAAHSDGENAARLAAAILERMDAAQISRF